MFEKIWDENSVKYTLIVYIFIISNSVQVEIMVTSSNHSCSMFFVFSSLFFKLKFEKIWDENTVGRPPRGVLSLLL
jgi:hypothetical protein